FALSENSITFNANKGYSKLKCTIAVLDGQKGGGIIQIESEQGVLYTSEEITSTTEPIELDISINQASRITIKQLSGRWSYNMVTDAILYNEE
ncbi:MAG: NPCBM/NEW2 domain-containing protein, partial [Anaeroplasmataceae bacterium]|nr:NPCBM/NEW2 domain-containing protein [Anaeroplasmataceae bacterium]